MGAPYAPPPPVAIMRVLSRFSRDEIEAFISIAIDLVDHTDGDPEAEECGLEDSFQRHPGTKPGCTLSDGEQGSAWVEWHGRRGRKVDRSGGEIMPRDKIGNILHEDVEDDDAVGEVSEDGCNTELWRLGSVRGAGCSLADPDLEHDGREPAEYVY